MLFVRMRALCDLWKGLNCIICGNEQSTHRPHSYKKFSYISYAIKINDNTLNYHYCLDIDDLRIGGQISPVGSTIFQS